MKLIKYLFIARFLYEFINNYFVRISRFEFQQNYKEKVKVEIEIFIFIKEI